MNFELNPSQKAIMAAAREFATKEFDPELAIELEKQHAFPKELYKKAAKLGFVAPYVDTAYGGDGLTILENALIVEEFCRADSSIGLAIDLTESDHGSDITIMDTVATWKNGSYR